ncbi:hypothetical protein ACQ4PT_035226 [Festuca glaucescens]
MAAAWTSLGTSSPRTLDPNREHGTGFSAEASSSSAIEARPVWRDPDGEEGVADLDSPWAAVAEVESRLEEAASAAEARRRAQDEAGVDEIQDNLQRQEDEVWCTPI